MTTRDERMDSAYQFAAEWRRAPGVRYEDLAKDLYRFLLKRDAARDSDRDASWRSVLDPIREMNNDISQHKCGTACVECGAFWTWTGYGEPWHFPDCTLFNLGAEEKR